MAEPNEVFVVVFLNSQHQVLACEPLFKGTVSEASVYPRVVVQRALELNASALIMSHQHPSGTTEPSMADRAITNRLKFILGMVRSEERRVGKECVSACRSRWSPVH